MITSHLGKTSSICTRTHQLFHEHLPKVKIRQLRAHKESVSLLIHRWANEWSIYTKLVGTKCSIDKTTIKTARTSRKTKISAHSNLRSATPASRSPCAGASLKKTSRGLLIQLLWGSNLRQRETIWVHSRRSNSWRSGCNYPFRKTSCVRKQPSVRSK